MHTFRITWRRFWAHWWAIFFYTIGFFLLPIYAKWQDGSTDIVTASLIALGCYFLAFIPTIILYWSYWKFNKGCEFGVNGTNCELRTKGEIVAFSLEDIEGVVQYMTPNEAHNRIPVLPWSMFNYSAIKLKDGREVIITSLLVPHLQIPYGKDLIEVKETFFPLIKKKYRHIAV